MKKKCINWCHYSYGTRETLKKMRLLVILFFSGLLTVAASSYSQQTKFSLILENVTVQEIFEQIEENSEFVIFYNEAYLDLEQKFDVNVKDESVEFILDKIFEKNRNNYKIYDRQIVILPPEKTKSSVIERNQQQERELTGKVVDEDGIPLPGASIVIKGTTVGAATNIDGNFTLTIPTDKPVTLVVQFIGFEVQEIVVGDKTTINVVLIPGDQDLDEVVVVGYGTMKRSDITGSVASVDGETLAKQGYTNASQALQGQVSGVTVVNTNGRPGAGAAIIIRGQGSYGGTAPLYVVDGAITGGINGIEPNDIASIEILKDASAAAIYGSRAANGVVIVTTKRGKSGESRITFNSNFGIQTLARNLEFASSQEWRDKEVWKFQNEGLPIPEKLQDGIFDPSISTDWQDELFRTAMRQNYNLSLSGGGENNNFNFSVGYTDQEGILVSSEYERINLRMNSDFISGNFKFGESFSVIRSKSSSTNATSFREWPVPVLKPQDEDGNYQALGEGYGVDLAQFLTDGNPLANIEIPDRGSSSVNIVGNVYGQFEFIEGLYAKTSVSVSWWASHNKTFTPVFVVGHLSNPTADLSESRSEGYTLLWENTLNFARKIGKHEVNAVAGWTRQVNLGRGISLRAEGFPEGIYQANAAETILPSSGGSENSTSLESYLGRVNYVYNGRYQLTASIRQDATSRLIKDLRTGTFPSFSLGWVASEEPFFPSNTIINRLKIRGGYGELGRLNSVGAYQVQNTLQLGGNNVDYILGSGQEFTNGVTQSGIVNSAILWERAQSTNIALEASLLDNRITFVAEYFLKNTKDLQFGAPIPYTVGTNSTSILVNAGDIENKGFEFTLGYHKTQGDFTFDIYGNLFLLKNKVKEFKNPDDAFNGGLYGFAGQSATRAEVGRELSNFWLLRTDGIFKSQAEIDAHSKEGALIQPNAQPGDLRFKDINDDGIINSDDKEFIDGSIPDFEYAVNFNGKYKAFDFSLILQGVAGAKIFNGVSRALGGTLSNHTNDYWREDNINAKFFRPSVSDPNGNRGSNDFYLENSSYLRLRNIAVGYTLPTSVLSKLNIGSARFSITGQNLLTFTEFSGYDPETVGFGLSRGVNTNVYPLSKTVLFGLTIDF